MRVTPIAVKMAFTAAIFLAASVAAQAQHTAHHSAPVPVSTARHAGTIVVRTTGTSMTQSHFHAVNGTQAAASNAASIGGSVPLSLQDLLDPFPSLPFSNNQSAYNNRQLAVMAAIDPITQFQVAQAEHLLRLNRGSAGGGFAFFTPSEPYIIGDQAAPPQQQPAPQIIILQQPAAPAAQSSQAPAESAQVAPAPQAPLHDVGEFVLVKRDGTQISAVGFTRQGDHIVYITQQ
ncbi:MAG: hypothetical protein ACRD4K_15980, partial [Candidatus Acidiferrales bacterium]